MSIFMSVTSEGFAEGSEELVPGSTLVVGDFVENVPTNPTAEQIGEIATRWATLSGRAIHGGQLQVTRVSDGCMLAGGKGVEILYARQLD